MVGSLEEVIASLADLCREKKIMELHIGSYLDSDRMIEMGNITIKMHELALKSPGVSQSAQSPPSYSDPPASPVATERKLRFGSGSP